MKAKKKTDGKLIFKVKKGAKDVKDKVGEKVEEKTNPKKPNWFDKFKK